MASQFFKFFAVTFLIVKQYLRILYRYDLSRRFFIDIYYAYKNGVYDVQPIVAIPEIQMDSRRSIQKVCIDEIAKGINETHSLLYNGHFQSEYAEKLLLVSDEELAIVTTLTAFFVPKNILEIGTYKGGLTYNFLLNSIPDASIDTIDLRRFDAIELIEDALLDSRINRIIKNSSKLDLDTTYDLIFIDGSHDYHDVKRDSELAFENINPKGIIIWHDYVEHIPGVFKYLEELSQRRKLKLIGNTSLVLFHNI